MGVIIRTSDFANFFAVAKTAYDETKLQAFIDRYEKEYVYRLMGVVQGKDFIADLSSYLPQAQKYQDIFYTFAEQDDDDTIYHSLGIKDILTACIFYHYITENIVKPTVSGVASPEVETAKKAAFDNAFAFAESRWNAMLDSWRAVQWFCVEHDDTYPDFKGELIAVKYSALF